MMVGWVIFGAGFILLSFSENILHFYVSFLVITLGQSVFGIPANSYRTDQLVQRLARESHLCLPVGGEPGGAPDSRLCLVYSPLWVASQPPLLWE